MSINKDDIQNLMDYQQRAYKDATEILSNALNTRIEDQNKLLYELRNSLEWNSWP